VRELKNIEHPMRLYKILPPGPLGDAPAAPSKSVAKPRSQSAETGLRTVADDLTRISVLVPGVVAVGLLVSEVLVVPSAGALPAGGAVLLSVVLGRVWAMRSNRGGRFLVALGIGIASGAFWTNWSRVTNGLFVLGGLIVSSIGASRPPRRE